MLERRRQLRDNLRQYVTQLETQRDSVRSKDPNLADFLDNLIMSLKVRISFLDLEIRHMKEILQARKESGAEKQRESKQKGEDKGPQLGDW